MTVSPPSRSTDQKRRRATCLFVDIGGVLLNDGWDHVSRAAAVAEFDLDAEELEIRHRQAFETFEVGGLSLDGYLDLVVFHRHRPFTRRRFTTFMFARSQPIPRMIALVRRLKARYGLKVVVVSNEARELNAHRIVKFSLDRFVDVFVSSCFVHLRKPDPEIFRVALDVAQVSPSQVIYLENSPMFVAIANGLGIRSILHTDIAATAADFSALGLQTGKP